MFGLLYFSLFVFIYFRGLCLFCVLSFSAHAPFGSGHVFYLQPLCSALFLFSGLGRPKAVRTEEQSAAAEGYTRNAA